MKLIHLMVAGTLITSIGLVSANDSNNVNNMPPPPESNMMQGMPIQTDMPETIMNTVPKAAEAPQQMLQKMPEMPQQMMNTMPTGQMPSPMGGTMPMPGNMMGNNGFPGNMMGNNNNFPNNRMGNNGFPSNMMGNNNPLQSRGNHGFNPNQSNARQYRQPAFNHRQCKKIKHCQHSKNKNGHYQQISKRLDKIEATLQKLLDAQKSK